MKDLGIIGCGWLGLRIAKHFDQQFKIFTTTTTESKILYLEDLGFNPTVKHFPNPDSEIWQKDAVIIAVTCSKKTSHEVLLQRFEGICKFLKGHSGPLFLTSSTGIYPEIKTLITETTFDDSELAPNLLLVEQLVKEYFPQTNILRLAGLMGDERYLAKYAVSSPDSPVNHIHYDDVSRSINILLEKGINGKTYNVAAPLHPSKKEVILYQTTGKIVTNEMNGGRIISSENLIKDTDFSYLHPNPLLFPGNWRS